VTGGISTSGGRRGSVVSGELLSGTTMMSGTPSGFGPGWMRPGGGANASHKGQGGAASAGGSGSAVTIGSGGGQYAAYPLAQRLSAVMP
jgi:hypothetical protein